MRCFLLALLLFTSPAFAEAFVAASDAARLELASEARVVGGEIRLAQVCRWDEEAAGWLAAYRDTIIVAADARYGRITADDVRTALRREGVAPNRLRFAGAAACSITRLDTTCDADAALAAWAEPAVQKPSIDSTLQDLLKQDFARRNGLPLHEVELQWAEGQVNASVLKLPAALFEFEIDARRAVGLGSIRYSVTVTKGGRSETHAFVGKAVHMVQAPVLTRALQAGMPIAESDVTIQRVEQTSSAHGYVSVDDIVGQAAVRDLQPGTLLTADLLRPVPLVERGQFISVTVSSGAVNVKTVAKALESGSLGQAIRVRDEATRRNYIVFVSGPQAASLDDRTASLLE